MNAVVVMRSLLLAHAPVTALVGQKVYAGAVQLDQLPAVGIKEIGQNEEETVSRDGRSTLVRSRVQVTVYATSYPQQKALLDAVALGPGTHKGAVAGVAVRSVLRATVGPDMGDPAIPSFEQSRDFIVTYVKPQ